MDRTSELHHPTSPVRKAGAADRAPDVDLPAWPVLVLLGGLPLWFVTGLLPFIHLPFGVVMVMYLIRLGRVRVVPGILPWLAFTAWTVACTVMLDSPLRLIGYGLRLSVWFVVGVLMLYVVNAPRTLPLRRALKPILIVWATTIVGGYLGVVFAGVAVPTPVSMVLPGVLLENEYVRDLVQPNLAQIDTPWGAAQPFVRPSAPFAYANSWGAAIAILTPIIIGAIVVATRLRTKVLLALGLVASALPALASSNRGMFLAVAVGLSYGFVRMALRGSRAAILGLGGLALAAAMELAFGFVARGILERQAVSNTTEGRAGLYLETFERTLLSPILGWGAPRPSINLGVSAGTQGQIWFIMFSFGLVGLALYLTFLWGAAVRTFDVPGNGRLWLHVSVFATGLLIFYYGLDATILQCVIAVVIAVLLRDKYLARRKPELLGSIASL